MQVSEPSLSLNNFLFKEFHPNNKENIRIRFFSTESFYFIYPLNGSVTFRINGNIKKIRPHESCLLFDPNGNGALLACKNSENPIFMAIGMHNQKEPRCFTTFKDAFLRTPTSNFNYYMGKTNLQISERINVLSQLLKSKERNEFIEEGLLFHIFGLNLIQMMDEHKSGFRKFRGFTTKEVEQLYLLSQNIAANPAKNYGIDSLCKEWGMGPNKLQKGFRKMHDKTILDYIRTKRLEKAVELMKTTNLSVSEIVYSVGFSSRSYFSKIFKVKYNCSPRQFQHSQRD